MNENFKQNVNSIRNGTEKVNSSSENLTKIKVSFHLTGSLKSHTVH